MKELPEETKDVYFIAIDWMCYTRLLLEDSTPFHNPMTYCHSVQHLVKLHTLWHKH